MQADPMKCLPLVVTLLWPCLVAGAADPQVVPIDDNERVVHVVGMPFNHSYCAPRLETLLLERFAWRGLVVRRVELRRSMASLLSELDARVLIHRPTLVVLQAGNNDLYGQRAVTFDFGAYQGPTEEIVKRLGGAGVKVILCSVTPFDNGSTPDRLLGPVAGLKTWVDAARQIAARHHAVFVDQFTEAVGWPMIGNDVKSKFFYDRHGHEKSWQLFAKQVRFEAAGTETVVNVGTGRTECRDAAVAELKIQSDHVSLTLQNKAGGGEVLVKFEGLARGRYRVTANGKQLVAKSAIELAAGVDLSPQLETRAASEEFQEELDRGHIAVASLAEIQNYRLPSWVKLADFQAQQQSALRRALDAVATHDSTLRALTVPKPLAIRVERIEDR